MQGFFNKISGSFSLASALPQLNHFDSKNPQNKKRSTSLEALLKTRKVLNVGNEQTSSETRTNSIILKPLNFKKVGYSSSRRDLSETNTGAKTNSTIFDKEVVTSSRQEISNELPSFSYRKISDGIEFGKLQPINQQKNNDMNGSLKLIAKTRYKSSSMEDRSFRQYQNVNRSLTSMDKMEPDNNVQKISGEKNDRSSKAIGKKLDVFDKKRAPKFSQQIQKVAIMNVGNLQLDSNFDSKPPIRRKIKVHKYSMLNFMKSQPHEPYNSQNRCLETESIERNNGLSQTKEPNSVLRFLRNEKKTEYLQKGEDNIGKQSIYISLVTEEGRPQDIDVYHLPKNSVAIKVGSLLDKSVSKDVTRETSQAKPTQSLELTPLKVKGRRKSSHPIFDDDIFNWKNIPSEEDHHKFEAQRSGIKKSKSYKQTFAKKLLKCLKKIKKLKLTPKEMVDNKQMFSKVPFEKEGSEDLFKAVKAGNARDVELILKLNGKYLVYDFDQLYQTTLHWAAKKDFEDVARILIQYGADIDARDLAGRTPLFFAIQNNSVSTLKVLLANQAYPWSNEDCNYYELCKSNDIALYYLKKAQQLHILCKMTGLVKKDEIWETHVRTLLLGPKFSVTEDAVRELFQSYVKLYTIPSVKPQLTSSRKQSMN